MADVGFGPLTPVDTFVSSADPVTDHSSYPYAPMLENNSAVLVKFGVTPPPGATFENCLLSFTVNDALDGSPAFSCWAAASDWVPSLGWADLPATSGSPVTATLVSGVWVFDVSSLLGSAPFGLIVKRTDTGVAGTFCLSAAAASSSGLDRSPGLVGQWQIAPDTPYDLVPSTGNAVGETKPIVGGQVAEVDWRTIRE